jgi:predicted RNA binding protein YcfA (HicA-like mRNA interferase family)
VLKVLNALDFVCTRQRGSHMIMQHQDGRTTVVPVHSGEDIHKGLLRSIINDVGFDEDAFIAMLDEA